MTHALLALALLVCAASETIILTPGGKTIICETTCDRRGRCETICF